MYNIPEYQRGYKWTEQQVEQLLKDTHEFETGGDNDLFIVYNITLVEKDGNFISGWSTAINNTYLLLSYFNEFTLVKNKINFSVRNIKQILQ